MDSSSKSGCLFALSVVGSLLVASMVGHYTGLSFGCSFLIIATCCLLAYYVSAFLKLADILKQGLSYGERESIGISLMFSLVPLGVLLLICGYIARPLLPNWRGGPVHVDAADVLSGRSLPRWVAVRGTECTGIRGPRRRQLSHEASNEQTGPLGRGRVRSDVTVYEEYREHLLLDPADPALDAWPAITKDLESLVALDADTAPEASLHAQVDPLLVHLHGLLADFHPGRGVHILESLGRRTLSYAQQGDDSISYALNPERENWDGVEPAAAENQYAALALSRKPGQPYSQAVKDLQARARRMLDSVRPGAMVAGNLEGTDLFRCREQPWWVVHMLAGLIMLLAAVVTVGLRAQRKPR